METLRNHHRYTSLSTHFPEIRVLKLLPDADPNGPVLGQFLHINLGSKERQRYDALSYTWGETSSATAQTIEIDGNANFLVTQNACQALKDIRAARRPLLIWIDAICIDQENVSERNSQVQMMTEIYTRAKTVRTWLDCNIAEEKEFFQTVESFDFSLYTLRSRWPEIKDLNAWSRVAKKISDSPYWTRVWIQQEVRNARRSAPHGAPNWARDYSHSIHFKRKEIKSWQLDFYLTRDYDAWAEPTSAKFQTGRISELLRGGPNASNHGRMYTDIFQALAWSGGLRATNPKDHVYGLLGAVDDIRIGELRIDYDATISEVFSRAAQYIVQRHRSVDFLPCASGANPALFIPDMPTWVPRWCDNHEHFRDRYWLEGLGLHHGAANLAAATVQRPAVSLCGKYLHVQGSRLGTIRHLFRACTTPGATNVWTYFHEHLRSFGFSTETAFCDFKELSENWYGSLPLLRPEEDFTDDGSLFRLARRMISEDMSSIEASITYSTSKIVKLFGELQRGFTNKCAEKTCIVTQENDVGLATILPELVRPGDEIWAIRCCTMFIVLRPRGTRYQALGGSRICGPYEGRSYELTETFKLVKDRGRPTHLYELILE